MSHWLSSQNRKTTSLERKHLFHSLDNTFLNVYKWKRISTYSLKHAHFGNMITDEFDDDEKFLKTTFNVVDKKCIFLILQIFIPLFLSILIWKCPLYKKEHTRTLNSSHNKNMRDYCEYSKKQVWDAPSQRFELLRTQSFEQNLL